MAEIEETTILQEGPIRITNMRALIGTLTYPMCQIKAVIVTRQGRSLRPMLLAIPGIVLIAWSLLDQTGQFMEFFNIGFALTMLGIVLVMIAKPTYAIQIGSSSGDASILRSTDMTFIQRIADAINTALARGK